MSTTSRTLNPLHFEDLEPRRFEDLVRQLAYDFRKWRRLEATGRAGSDDGFDARGWELVDGTSFSHDGGDEADDNGEGASDSELGPGGDRIWLIQCKRERRIGPTKLTRYLDDIPEDQLSGLYGVLIAAACDFSKTNRDRFRDWCASHGIAEWHLWGRAEIEDMLFRPANDHLLFAYFGISLQIRKRSLKSELRARLATKKAVRRHVENYDYVLLRDPSDDRYPELADGLAWDRMKRGRWRVTQVEQLCHDGLHVILRQSLAYLGSDGRNWDYPELSHNDRPGSNLDQWLTREERDEAKYEEQDAERKWMALPEDQRGRLNVIAVLPFDAIVAIDEEGDDVFGDTHIFTTEWREDAPPFLGMIVELRAGSRQIWHPEERERVRIFRRHGDAWEHELEETPTQGGE